MRYEFLAAVMNKYKGEKGYHSVELVSMKKDYYIRNDEKKVRRVDIESVDLHPRLLFYKRI